MSLLYRRLLLPGVRLLTRRDAEIALDWHIAALRMAQSSGPGLRLLRLGHRLGHRPPADGMLAQTLMSGLAFPHPFGIAAGYDKNAKVYPAFEAHHSPGFIEVGTVTLAAQAGNPRPRIRRLGADHLVNSMGFPNDGAPAIARNLRLLPPPRVPLGLNIGKAKTSAVETVPQEYRSIVGIFDNVRNGRPLPDYFAVNVSSPNTPGLRVLQGREYLARILEAVAEAIDGRRDLAARPRRRILVKLAPDLPRDGLETVAELVVALDLGGLILTNTHPHPGGGGLSGPELFRHSSQRVRQAAALLPADRVIVATGGMDRVDRVYEMLHYADLVGLYTGLVLQGPGLLRRLCAGVRERMMRDGVKSLSDLRSGNRSPS